MKRTMLTNSIGRNIVNNETYFRSTKSVGLSGGARVEEHKIIKY